MYFYCQQSTVTFWEKLYFLKICFFSCWNFECKFHALCKNNFSAAVQTHSKKFARFFFEKKLFFSIFPKFLIVLVLWAKFSKPFDGKNKEELSNQPLTRGEHHSEGKMKTPQRFIFRVLTAEKNCRIFFGRLAIIFRVHRNTLRKTVSLKIFFFFLGLWVYFFLPYRKNEISELGKTTFYVSKKSIFLKKFKKEQMLSFLLLTVKNILRNLCGRLVKIFFCLVHINTLRKTVSLKVIFLLLKLWISLFCLT